MEQYKTDEMYMQRCLQLARNGRLLAKPNPMVGAVIVSGEGNIIGEGYHVRCGEGHAEVNAFASIRPEDEHLLSESTLYVSLEPCSHYGKTPPCADLIVRKGVKRVVCGCIDPFAKVQGRGVKRIREAGIAVTVGVLEAECLALNKRFITYNTQKRPYIILKWAQTANGFMGKKDSVLKISTPFTQMLVHKLRSESDAILVGRVTEEQEKPLLTVRHWSGRSPKKVVLSRALEATLSSSSATIYHDIPSLLQALYEQQCQSLIVEGGAKTLGSFLEADLYDEIRVETAPFCGAEGIKAPTLPNDLEVASTEQFENVITTYYRKHKPYLP